jgi:hypothetical protein
MPFLGEDYNWEVALQWYGGGLGVSGLDATARKILRNSLALIVL